MPSHDLGNRLRGCFRPLFPHALKMEGLEDIDQVVSVSAQNVKSNDIIIFIMESLGERKSTFIEAVLQGKYENVDHCSNSSVSAVRLTFKNGGNNVVLAQIRVSSPEPESVRQGLFQLELWLQESVQNNNHSHDSPIVPRIAGIVYLFAIWPESGPFSQSSDMLEKLLVNPVVDKIILAMPNHIGEIRGEGDHVTCERDLKEKNWQVVAPSGPKDSHRNDDTSSTEQIMNVVLAKLVYGRTRELGKFVGVDWKHHIATLREKLADTTGRLRKFVPGSFLSRRVVTPTESNTGAPLPHSRIFTERNFHDIVKVAPVEAKDLNKDDMIIAVMGPTGAGKSTFIQTVTRAFYSNNEVGHHLASATTNVSALRIIFRDDDKPNIVLVDTPGFDDTNRSDFEVLGEIARWLRVLGKPLANAARSRRRLSGILYLHRITDTRMTGSATRNLQIFQKLCGDSYYRRVILVTTMWSPDFGPEEQLECERLEAALQESHWQPMIHLGSQVLRFLGTLESAQDIVNQIVGVECQEQQNTLEQIIEIQTEMLVEHKSVPSTQAGRHVKGDAEELIRRQNEALEQLSAERDGVQDLDDLREILDSLKAARAKKREVEKKSRPFRRPSFTKTSSQDRAITSRFLHPLAVLNPTALQCRITHIY
ncbi:hypothetical protein NP233_g3417 [Leucocoprinus birnbaumii]|uniref:G domain-containing protein n=1 Tax=Leucocoprinus birnbaumii TaxID=56174 RepID=A0AAD5VWI1_9AGAR|nr:hypothetical protein NP233_g3417 [Leucocoprinus birnbaumii]